MTSRRTIVGSMMILGAVMSGLTGARVAYGQSITAEPANVPKATKEDTKAQTGAAEQPPAKEPQTPSSSPGGTTTVLGPRFRRHIANMTKLREMIEQKLELGADQKEKIGRLFDEFIEEIKTNPAMLPMPAGQLASKTDPADRRELEEKMRKAEQAGDKTEAEKLRAQINAPKQAVAPSSTDRTPQWIEKVRAELKPDQVEAFQKIVGSWEEIASRIPIMGPFQALERGLRDPAVGLSKDELAALGKILDDTLWDHVANTKVVTRESLAEAAEKAQIAVNEKLSPPQREVVGTFMARFESQKKLIRDSISPSPPDLKPMSGGGADTGACLGPPEKKDP